MNIILIKKMRKNFQNSKISVRWKNCFLIKRLKQCFLKNLYIHIYSNILYMWLRLVEDTNKLYSCTKKQRCFHKREGGGRNLLYRSQSIPPQSPSHETVKFHIMVTRNFFPSSILLYLFYFLLLFFSLFFL